MPLTLCPAGLGDMHVRILSTRRGSGGWRPELAQRCAHSHCDDESQIVERDCQTNPVGPPGGVSGIRPTSAIVVGLCHS